MNQIVNASHITDLKSSMVQAVQEGYLKQVEFPLEHYHTPELYGRRIFVPAGATVVTKVHKSEHITVALKGHCVVVDELGGRKDVIAPAVFVTKPGTQRAVYAVTDVEWFTAHAYQDEDKTLENIENTLACDTIEQYKNLLGAPQ